MIDRELKIGDKVWYPAVGTRLVREDCQVCFGNLRVVVRLGNNIEVSTPCSHCGRGYEGSSGYTNNWERVARAEQVSIAGMTVRVRSDKREIEYALLAPCVTVTGEDLFETEELCAIEVTKRNEAQSDAEDCSRKSSKKSSIEKLTWNVGYHQREARELRAKIAYHDERALVLKARNKEIKG